MKPMENFAFIEQLTGVKPDVKGMARAENAQDVDMGEIRIHARLQKLFQDEILKGNVEAVRSLEQTFGRQFTMKNGDLQILYAKMLMNGNDGVMPYQGETLAFLVERTGIRPSLEIIRAKYQELLSVNFRAESIEAFQKVVEIPPSKEIVQAKYRNLFEQYVKDADGGDGYLEQSALLARTTGIRPHFDRDFVLELYTFCVTSGPEYHQKLGVIANETGVAPDRNFIQIYLLDNANFSNPVPLQIDNDQLDEHFADARNRTLGEYIRIYRIFGCFDYYQRVIGELEHDKTPGARRRVIAMLAAMGLRDMEHSERYAPVKERLMSLIEEEGASMGRSLGEALGELARNGDDDLLTYLASAIRERTKAANGKDERRGALGFTALQEVALRTLFHVDNPVSNRHLLSLLSTGGIDPRVKMLILKNLIAEKPDFFPDAMRAWADGELADKKSKFVWDDLRYFQATIAISSADLRQKSLYAVADAFKNFITFPDRHPSDVQRNHCPHVPENVFLPIYEFTGGNVKSLEQFNGLYKATKSSAEKDALLFGIVNALSIGRDTLDRVLARLSDIDLTASGAAAELGMVLKTLSFLDTVECQLRQTNEETDDVLSSPVESLGSLNESLRQIATRKIKEILPNESITADTIQALWEQWGGLEPIFVYAGKMASKDYGGTLRLVAEMVAHMDAPEYAGWKRWRYDRQEAKVREQIGHLTEDQLEVWKNDHFAELGDIMVATTPSDKPKQISRFIEGSLREGHIYNPNIHSSDRHKFIQEKLGEIYAAVAEHPDQRETIFNGAADLLQKDIEKIDAVTQLSHLPKLEQALVLFADGKNVPVNAKTKNSVNFLGQFLSREAFLEIEKAYKEAEEARRSTVDGGRLVHKSTKELLRQKIEEIKQEYEQALQTDVFEQYGLSREQTKNVGPFYQKRQELKALLDLYRISALDVKRIATNKISDRADKRGESLMKVIENLKQYFKDNPAFVQDIENIHAVVSQKETLGTKRRLAMVISDSPQMLFQAGKYPFGCGSCQNYEGDPNWNRSLAGYVADAHIKVAYLVDLNDLSDHLRTEIETRGFDEVKGSIPHQELLEASVARAIAKITRIPDSGEPALFVEPTYSSINKGDLAMDKYFNIFLELLVSGPMGIRLVRGWGSESVRVPKSRNPNGQYEDCAGGNAGNAGMGIQTGSYTMSARFIDRFSPTTDADRRLAERISGE
jgi:hypothetical protein